MSCLPNLLINLFVSVLYVLKFYSVISVFMYFLLLSFPFRIRNCLTHLNAKDITPDDKQELDEALQREVIMVCKFLVFVPHFLFVKIIILAFSCLQIQAAFRTDEIRRFQPTPQDEMRAGMSYFHETIWKGVPKFLRRVDTALKNIGINERVPYNAPLIQFSSWMGGDRDGNQFFLIIVCLERHI